MFLTPGTVRIFLAVPRMFIVEIVMYYLLFIPEWKKVCESTCKKPLDLLDLAVPAYVLKRHRIPWLRFARQ